MQASRISVKLWFSADDGLELDDFVPVFHGWIREQKLSDEVMIDVADYAHVENGPGVLLVCHEGHYVIERHAGRWALAYHRKRGGETDDLDARVAVPLRRIAFAARLLEGEPELSKKVRFETSTLELAVRCRLHAPNTTEVRATLVPAIAGALQARVGGEQVELEALADDPRKPFTVRARLPEAASLEHLAA